MAAAPWKTPFWTRVKNIHGFVYVGRVLFPSVQRDLALPVRATDGERGISMIKAVEEKLVAVSRMLLFTMMNYGSIEVLSVCNIRTDDGEEQRALTNLRAARTHVKAGYNAVVRALGHMQAAGILIGHPRIPGVDDYIDAERLAAIAEVETAMAEVAHIDTAAAVVAANYFLAH